MIVVRTEPIATIKMTGFFTCKAGFSFVTLSFAAWSIILVLKRPVFSFVLMLTSD